MEKGGVPPSNQPPPAYSDCQPAPGYNTGPPPPAAYPPGPQQPGYPPGPQQAGYPPGPQQAGYPPGPQQAGYPPGPQQAGYPPGPQQAAYPQPAAPTQTQPVVTSTVVVHSSPTCPHCGVGYRVENFTTCGIILAICFFPLGLICCLLMKESRCSNCGRPM